MCRLTNHIQQMSNDVKGDAILLQHKESVGSKHCFNLGAAIIRRIDTPTGVQWSFNTLMSIADTPLPCAGIVGSIEDVVTRAKYQFGPTLYQHEFFAVSYRDANFPPNLIP